MEAGSYYGLVIGFLKVPVDEQGAFFDETGISSKIDFVFDKRLSLDELHKEFNVWGFDITREFKPMKVVVIKDWKGSGK